MRCLYETEACKKNVHCTTCSHYIEPEGITTKLNQTNAEHIRSMTNEELAEWLDTNGMWDGSPWSKWFDSKYCQQCESVKATVEDDFGNRECEFAYCELENKCRYFVDYEDVPDCKDIIKMWLESEAEDEEII